MTQIRIPLRRAAFALLVVAALGAERTVAAQSAAARYQQVLAREQAARAAPSPAPARLRAVAASYENITRQHPTSGYADNALWQASGLLEFASMHGGTPRDRDNAIRLLNWLRKEYPTSSLVKQAETRLSELGASSASTATAAAAPKALGSDAATPANRPASRPSSSAATVSAPPAVKAVDTSSRVDATPAKADPAIVTAITRTALVTGDRITIELDRETAYSSRRDTMLDRILCDVANATISPALVEQASSVSGTLVKSSQAAALPDGTTRLALELSGRARYSTFPLYHPFRLVIDIESDPAPAAAGASPTPAPIPPSQNVVAAISMKPTAMSDFSAVADHPKPVTVAPQPAPPVPAAPASTAKGDYSLSRQLGLGVSRIVIDPGHGGRDPGALGTGVTEAEVVLDVALRLRKLLQAHPGIEVVLTRQTDEFVPLEQRTAIANRENADLFLSIHANAGGDTAHGVETYFLNLATTPHAEAVAARENASSTQTMGVLPAILKAITLNDKLSESREFATMVQTSLVRRLAVQNKTMKDLGVKQAPFQVLVGARMPSVLAEIAFLTNQGEASLVQQPAYRQRIAQALYEAVVRYQSSLKKATTTLALGD